MLDYSFEEVFLAGGYTKICGVDEAGRGPLAGPVVAGACILPMGLVIPELDDSKKLSEKKRERLYDEICCSALSWGIGLASPEEIDTYNILEGNAQSDRFPVCTTRLSPYRRKYIPWFFSGCPGSGRRRRNLSVDRRCICSCQSHQRPLVSGNGASVSHVWFCEA